jgi:amidase
VGPGGEVAGATLSELQAQLRSGALSARRLCESYLARIEALDRAGPELRSVLEVDPDALATAERLDAERRDGRLRGALHGIPVLLKDNVDTADRMLTTAGSLALVDSRPARDAFIVSRLREAGAVLLGKANLSEWANFRSLRSSSGWSARGGQCRNPRALEHSPSGSSSGPAAAVAAGLCAVAVGTETDGSIVCPASACAVVGLKPTVGRVSRSGIVPVAHSQDTPGPLARSVRDAALLLGVLAGTDADDAATRAGAAHACADYERFLDPSRSQAGSGLRGARIGVPREALFGYSAAADRIAERALEVLRREGACVVDPVELPHASELRGLEFEVLLHEFKSDLNRYLAGRPDAAVRTLEELIRFNEKYREREMPWFAQELFESAQEKGGLDEPVYREALALGRRLAGPEGLDAVLDAHRLDALVAPTTSPPCAIDLEKGDVVGGSCSAAAAVAGYPAISVPAGDVDGLPVGLCFIGRAWSEPTLLRLAFAFEQAIA